MKKITSLLISIILICSLFAFVGCDRGNAFSGTTTTHKRIAPSERPAELDTLSLNYTDDFNKYDIEFAKGMYERVSANKRLPITYGYDSYMSFSSHMNILSKETDTFYKVNVDLEGEPYFISVYGSESSIFLLPLYGDAENVQWHKCYKYDNIPESIDGLTLIGSYAVYDCVVEKDVLNGTVFDLACKYYLPLVNGYDENNNSFIYGLCESVLWYDAYKMLGRDTPLAIMHTVFFAHVAEKDMFEYYVDKDGVEYLVMPYEHYKYSVDAAWRIGDKASALEPYIIRNAELDDHYYENGQIKDTLEKYCIPVSNLVDICWKQ